MFDYDVIFIGSGHACNHGAIALKLAGKRVAMVEREKNGGTCTNFGCDAKILLDGPFEYQEGLARYQDLGIAQVPEVNWPKLMAYKKQHIGAFDPMLGQLFTGMGLDLLKGQGTLSDAHTVKVDGKAYTAEYIVIGAGARDSKLNIPGREYIHDSKDFLDLDILPERIAMIGMGIITMEFASMALALGKSVTLIAHGDRALRQYPADYVQRIIQKMTVQGARFCWKEDVSKIQKTGEGYRLTTEKGLVVDCDYVLEGTGRIANYEGLGLEALGIEASSRGIVVDDHMRTAVSNIYASGDVVMKRVPKLTPTAEFESNYIAGQILGLSDAPIAYPAIPNLVFTLPRIAQVGVSVDAAKADPDHYRVSEVAFGQQNEWVNNREKEASMTFVFDTEGYLVGAALYTAEAAMMLDFLTLVINKRMTAMDLRSMIFAFPTQTYSLVSALVPMLRPM